MASKKIKADELAITVGEMLAEYAGLTEEVVETAAKQTLKDARTDVTARSPRGSRAAQDNYANSWRVDRPKWTKKGVLRGRVYSEQYQLTHLLEHGHAMRQGGRAKAIPHIAPANDAAQAEFERLIKEGLQK